MRREIAKASKRMAGAGLNIDSVFLIGKKDTPAAMATVASGPKKAKQLFG